MVRSRNFVRKQVARSLCILGRELREIISSAVLTVCQPLPKHRTKLLRSVHSEELIAYLQGLRITQQ